ncbi:MAG TPA: hypothetical protein PKU97_02615, partial [Kofleriaceae bacterium]|nr:hypothetical protein [Kofleriaceae bacterium]
TAPAPAPITAPVTAPASAPAALGSVTFAMDAWCELVLDGLARGRADRGHAISLPAGQHQAECSQGPGLGRWRGSFEVKEGQHLRITGELRAEVSVEVAVSGSAVSVDGVVLANGRQVKLHNGRHRVTVRQGERELSSGWVSIPRVSRCVLRDQPLLDCYPTP